MSMAGNRAERHSKFYVPEGVPKVSVKQDQKAHNAIQIKVEREDHTIGNLVRHQLHRDSDVLFAGYKVNHPLEPNVKFMVQTVEKTPPLASFQKALSTLEQEIDDIQTQLRNKSDYQ